MLNDVSEQMIAEPTTILRGVLAQLNDSLRRDQERVRREFTTHKERLEKEPGLARRRQDQAYLDKLDGKITEEFWNRQMSELATSEQRIAAHWQR